MADKTMPHAVCKKCARVPVKVEGTLLLDLEGLCWWCRSKLPPPKR